MSELDALARKLADFRRRLDGLERSARLSRASVLVGDVEVDVPRALLAAQDSIPTTLNRIETRLQALELEGSVPHARRVHNALLTIPDDTETILPWNTQTLEPRGGISYAGGVFTVPRRGVYLVNAGVHQQTTVATGIRRLWVLVGGNVSASVVARNDSVNESLWITRTVWCDLGDTIALQYLQNSGASRDLFNGAEYNYVDVTWLGD